MTTYGGKLAALLLGAMMLAGCSTAQIQIWGNSDANDSKLYTQRNPQYVHVGETLDLRILVAPDAADYVLIDFGGQISTVQKINPGEYVFSHRFDRDARDARTNITVRAYRQQGRPDVMVENGTARTLAPSEDPPDELLGQASLLVECYQSKAVVCFSTADRKEPDWSKMTLEIYGPDNRLTTVRRSAPDLDGFVPLGCDAWGSYTVFYEPKFEEVNRTGKTRVVVILPDPAGKNDQRFETWIDTP